VFTENEIWALVNPRETHGETLQHINNFDCRLLCFYCNVNITCADVEADFVVYMLVVEFQNYWIVEQYFHISIYFPLSLQWASNQQYPTVAAVSVMP
jgi:hypothetical protein